MFVVEHKVRHRDSIGDIYQAPGQSGFPTWDGSGNNIPSIAGTLGGGVKTIFARNRRSQRAEFYKWRWCKAIAVLILTTILKTAERCMDINDLENQNPREWVHVAYRTVDVPRINAGDTPHGKPGVYYWDGCKVRAVCLHSPRQFPRCGDPAFPSWGSLQGLAEVVSDVPGSENKYFRMYVFTLRSRFPPEWCVRTVDNRIEDHTISFEAEC